MITKQIKRKIRFEIETERNLNLEEYKECLDKLEELKIIKDNEIEKVVEELKEGDKNIQFTIKNKTVNIDISTNGTDILYKIRTIKKGK